MSKIFMAMGVFALLIMIIANVHLGPTKAPDGPEPRSMSEQQVVAANQNIEKGSGWFMGISLSLILAIVVLALKVRAKRTSQSNPYFRRVMDYDTIAKPDKMRKWNSVRR